MRWMGPSIWTLVPEDVKKAKTQDLFKRDVKKLTLVICSCKLCKEYIRPSYQGTYDFLSFWNTLIVNRILL